MSGARFQFFSGKGGVGKTSMACATAVRQADEGRRTLIVTTDPASNLADVFAQPIGHRITPVKGVPNLWAVEIDPDAATAEYVARAIGPLREVLPPDTLRVVEEQMSGPCTQEVAAFDRFADFIGAPTAGGRPFDAVIFDTAPTGHTLRLLELPAAWSRAIDEAVRGGGQTCIGPVAVLQARKAKYDHALRALRSPELTVFTFVLQPEAISIRETRRSIEDLRRLGITSFALIVNGILPPAERSNPFFSERARMQERHLERIGRELPYPSRRMLLFDGEIAGAERLRQVGRMLFDGETAYRLNGVADAAGGAANPGGVRASDTLTGPADAAARAEAIRRLVPERGRRSVFFTGKGGVGKTVLSCLTAVWLADRGYRTLLLTTDPAAHLGDVLEVEVGSTPTPVEGVANLWAARVDAKAAAEAYKARILEDARRRGRDEAALAVMAEELDSPCTEEMAAFDRFIDYATEEGWDVIVFDTAPTGHTLRLLELPVDWSAQIDAKRFASPDAAGAHREDREARARFQSVIEGMRDPARSTFAFVVYPENTPVVEARRAVEELRTVGVEAGLVFANQVLPPEAGTTPYGRSRRAMQQRYLEVIARSFGTPVLTVPLLPAEVRGLDRLRRLGANLYGENVDAVASVQ